MYNPIKMAYNYFNTTENSMKYVEIENKVRPKYPDCIFYKT